MLAAVKVKKKRETRLPPVLSSPKTLKSSFLWDDGENMDF